MQIKEFQSEENAGERIDKFLTEKVPELSRSCLLYTSPSPRDS